MGYAWGFLVLLGLAFRICSAAIEGGGLICGRLRGALPFSGIQRLRACRADAMREVSIGMVADIALKVVPRSAVITYLLAGRAHRKQTFQRLHLVECFLELPNQRLTVKTPCLAALTQGGD